MLWCLAGLAGADPVTRVAIVTPLTKNVQLDGVLLKTPKIAAEGQKLTLPNGASARVQLLGSPKETTVNGQADYVISRAKLEKDAKVLSRGAITVEAEIGDVARAAAVSARATGVEYVPIGFVLEVPPQQTSFGYAIRILTPKDRLSVSPQDPITLTVTDLDAPGSRWELVVDQPAETLEFPEGMLTLGHRYEIDVARGERGYLRHFRLLTPEEHAEAKEAAKLMRVDALQSGDIALLLRLANFYQNMDDNESAAAVLKEVVNNPGYAELSAETQAVVKRLLNKNLNSLDQRNYVAVK
jgi:hypothetical protein